VPGASVRPTSRSCSLTTPSGFDVDVRASVPVQIQEGQGDLGWSNFFSELRGSNGLIWIRLAIVAT
jgi:hypothetical protein